MCVDKVLYGFVGHDLDAERGPMLLMECAHHALEFLANALAVFLWNVSPHGEGGHPAS